jgi:hypothetical protein
VIDSSQVQLYPSYLPKSAFTIPMHVPDTAALSIALIENIQREDLSAAGGDGVDATQTVHLWRSQYRVRSPGASIPLRIPVGE